VRADVAINAWNAFEARAPLDPRISDILLRRALLNTKLVNGLATDHGRLEAAARDYRAALDRSDGISTTRGDEQMLGNLAETYMMLDRLDDAIDMYQQAVAAGAARTSTVYGLAVALDRDGQGDQAIRRILGQGEEGFDSFEKEFFRATIFFVPEGESNYYFALANEAFGNDGQALEYWGRYLKSGAHPEFQPRAKEHIEQLIKRGVHAESPAPFRDSD
jgi:tetratricopeptide (TPR) repeat protein